MTFKARDLAADRHPAERRQPGCGRFEAFEDELSKLRQELSETQERLDFVERRLVQGSEPRRVPPERGG